MTEEQAEASASHLERREEVNNVRTAEESAWYDGRMQIEGHPSFSFLQNMGGAFELADRKKV